MAGKKNVDDKNMTFFNQHNIGLRFSYSYQMKT